jgi:hypothetical protein
MSNGIQYADFVRNAKMDAIETAIGTSPFLSLYDGAMPANCATARAGTLFMSAALPADWLGNAAAGVKSLAGTWSGTATAPGLARYFTIYKSDGTTIAAQGLVSEAYLNSKTLVLNQQVHVGSNVYKVTTAGTTASTGTGPTGTGTGIADGTVTFAYVGPAGLKLDNSSFNTSQALNVSSASLTDGNG